MPSCSYMLLHPDSPALVLAPMDGVTDPPMRAVQGEMGAFTFAVSEFIRVNDLPVPRKVFVRDVPELLTGAATTSGLPVQVQILGGNPETMAESAVNACKAGARAVDINFGCPAPTVNRNDGGASLLRCPERIRDIVTAVRQALPPSVPVSAKLRLGWVSVDEIAVNAAMAAEGGANWLTIHARTKLQKYHPPVFWESIGRVREQLAPLPIVANGDVWTLEDFRRCREQTGCSHFMLGRGALARPGLAREVAREMGLPVGPEVPQDWLSLLGRLSFYSKQQAPPYCKQILHRLKQWLNFASRFGGFSHFERAKMCQTEEALFELLATLEPSMSQVAEEELARGTR